MLNYPDPLKSVRLRSAGWEITVQVYPSGRVFEEVELRGIAHHQVWRDLREIGGFEAVENYAAELLRQYRTGPEEQPTIVKTEYRCGAVQR